MATIDIHPTEGELAWAIQDEHLEEAEFLFEVRETTLGLPHHTLETVRAGPERRLLAHVDALIVGGPIVERELLLPTIEDPDADYGTIAAAALSLIGDGSRELERVWTTLERSDATQQRQGLTRALQLSASATVQRGVERRLSSMGTQLEPGALAAYLEVLVAHRVAPTRWLPDLLAREDPRVVEAAVTLVRFCDARSFLHLLGTLAHSPDPDVRRMTLETALCQTLPGAWESALHWAFHPQDSAIRREALVWVACFGDAAAHARILGLVDDKRLRSDAIWALGFSGRVAAVDRCVELLADEDVGPLAGDLVCAIAGLPRDEDRFWSEPPAPEPQATLPSLIHDDLEADLVPTPEAHLPIPEPESIAAWWRDRRRGLAPEARHLDGRPLDHERCLSALHRGPAHRRGPLAFELAVRSGAAAFVDARAMCAAQDAQLQDAAALGSVDYQRGWSPR